MYKKKVFHIFADEIREHITSTNPWGEDVPSVNSIQKMHVVRYDFEKDVTNLWISAIKTEPSIMTDHNIPEGERDLAVAPVSAIPNSRFIAGDAAPSNNFFLGDWCVVTDV